MSSILIHGPLPTPDQLEKLKSKFGLSEIVANWTPQQKFPKHRTLVHALERPASFKKRDPRVMSVEEALVHVSPS